MLIFRVKELSTEPKPIRDRKTSLAAIASGSVDTAR
jgi:hypothetical protein